MNQLNTATLGGLPLSLNDIDYLTLALKDALKGSLSWVGETFVISGCVLNFPTDISAGFILIEGEVYYTAGNAFGSPVGMSNPSLRWVIEETYPTEGAVTLDNLTSGFTQVQRTAKYDWIDLDTFTDDSWAYPSTLSDTIKAAWGITGILNGWTDVSYNSSLLSCDTGTFTWAAGAGKEWAYSYKLNGKTLHLNVRIKRADTAGTANELRIHLPNSLVNKRRIAGVAQMKNNSNPIETCFFRSELNTPFISIEYGSVFGALVDVGFCVTLEVG